MSFLTMAIGIIAFVVILTGIFWIGFYVVLPIVLFLMLVSAITSLISGFKPDKPMNHRKLNSQKPKEHQIIDVEFEEIK